MASPRESPCYETARKGRGLSYRSRPPSIRVNARDIASRYLALARRNNPKARIVYSVADLHHVRLARQAAVEDRPELLAASQRMRMVESVAACSSDAVITHSTTEAAALRALLPQGRIHQIGWDVAVSRRRVPFAARHGLAFIGGYSHAPNLDAAHWLVEAVMPLVWQVDASIECVLVGADLPASLRRLNDPRIVALGQVEDLDRAVFDRVRLTVAPLRYGAGVKGKVLESFAAGTPCVMSESAAEGIALPRALQALVGQDAPALAGLICQLHGNKAAHAKAVKAGRAMIHASFSAERVTAGMAAVLEAQKERQDASRRAHHGRQLVSAA
jgi:glycosyltransferase involved in cell wall biosynthesis